MFDHLEKKANHLPSMNHIRIENSVWFAGRLNTILLSIHMTNCVSFFARFSFPKELSQSNERYIRVNPRSDHVKTWISSLHCRNQKIIIIIYFFIFSLLSELLNCGHFSCVYTFVTLGSDSRLENAETFFLV